MRVYVAWDVRARFEEKYEPEPTSGCWLWTGSVNRKGYGKFVVGHQAWRLAHRVAWELYCGPIPNGICVLHHCDTPSCVNPDHLFLGTKADNNRDMARKGRVSNGRLRLTRCKRGHPFDAITPQGVRRCRACTAYRQRRRRQSA